MVKDRLFYSRFKYVMNFELDEVNCLRTLDHDHIDSMMKKRRQWIEIAQQRWLNGKQNMGTIMSRGHRLITDHTVKNLHTLAESLLTTDVEFKLVVSLNQGWIYANDTALFDQLDQLPILQYKTYSEVQVDRPRDTVKLKNSKHKFRSYFRFTKLTVSEKDTLTDFLSTQQSFVRLSPSLKEWLGHPFNRVQDYFFVDYDTASWLTMLSLVRPGMIRKTMQIIPAK